MSSPYSPRVAVWYAGHVMAGSTVYRTTRGWRIEGGSIGYRGIQFTAKTLTELVDRAFDWWQENGILYPITTKAGALSILQKQAEELNVH